MDTNFVRNDPSGRVLHDCLVLLLIQGNFGLVVLRRDEVSVLDFGSDRSDILLDISRVLPETLLEQILLIFEELFVSFEEIPERLA